MKTHPDESADLLDMLLFTVKVIATSEPGDKQRIANVIRCSLACGGRSAWTMKARRGHVLLHVSRFIAYKTADDVAAAGWILTAIQERVAERDLPGLATASEDCQRCGARVAWARKTALH